MKNIDLARHLPCGFPVKMEKSILAGILGSAIGLTLPLLVRMENAKNDLYTYRGTRKVLIEGAVMVDFIDLVEHAFLGFFLAIALALAFGFYHYAFHHQGSKSIYLMRRLPNGFELHRRCWTVPVAAALPPRLSISHHDCSYCKFTKKTQFSNSRIHKMASHTNIM